MARPNFHKTEQRVSVKVSKDFYHFMIAWKHYRMNDGQRLATNKASFADLTSDFLSHYWSAMSLSRVGLKLERYYKEVSKSAKNT